MDPTDDVPEASKPKPNRTRRLKGRSPANPPTEPAAESPAESVAENQTEPKVVRRRRLGGSPEEASTATPGTATPGAPPLPPPPSVSPPPAKPKIGDTRPAPAADSETPPSKRRRGGRRGGRNRNRSGSDTAKSGNNKHRRSGSSKGNASAADAPVETILADDNPVELDAKQMSRRRGAERDGKPLGRYRLYASVKDKATHIAITEGRTLVEHYVTLPTDEAPTDGNIYLGVVSRVLPGLETAFVDIGSEKHAVIHRSDLTIQTDQDDASSETDGNSNGNAAGGAAGNGNAAGGAGSASSNKPRQNSGKRSGGFRSKRDGPRIEEVLKANQQVLCQVVKRPIAHKGARLTTGVSLPGRFVVLVPNSTVMGISRQIDSKTTKRLRSMLQEALPKGFGAIVRTAAEHVTPEEVRRDIERLIEQWNQIVELSKRTTAPSILFKEPDMTLRLLREEFSAEFREVVIDDPTLYEKVRSYMEAIATPSLDRIVLYDTKTERLPLMEKYKITEQLRKAVDKKVWLPSGGSLIIEHTEALTVIDVNTGKNVGSNSLDETLFLNNLEAAEEVARQLRLRDIGGIIVIDFVDMESKQEREQLLATLRMALSRDKTRFSVDTVSSFGVVQMTRKRVGEGLLESVTHICGTCEGAGLLLQEDLL